MAMHGSISEYTEPGGKEAWSTYTERLGYYFDANGVKDAGKKRSILLAVCGPATFNSNPHECWWSLPPPTGG